LNDHDNSGWPYSALVGAILVISETVKVRLDSLTQGVFFSLHYHKAHPGTFSAPSGTRWQILSAGL
jgi:hypothetical protein